MPIQFNRWIALLSVCLLLLAAKTCGADETKGIEFFEQHIRPVLVKHCYECHSAESEPVQGGLRVDTRAALLKGGDNGPAIVPGSADRSLLIQALRQQNFEMPPEGKLPDETIDRFVQWVRLDAPMPKADQPTLADADASEEARNHWAFQPPASPAVPQVKNQQWPRSEIDRFVLARLEQEGLQPVEQAERQTLIRRAYFDLWGLPPSPEAIQAFLGDRSSQAFANLVDRLLDSPRFGEHWGRHWLDIARYAESTGYERNFLYPHAWRYRDYVISAFNQDKPYDRFLLEQIAGDKLPAKNLKQRDEQHTATGFLALGPRNLLGGNEEFRLDTADDQINVTMRAILGLTVSCARCHDHKFDPISTEEYYGLAGIFLSTETLYGTQPGSGGGSNRHPTELIPLGPDAEQRHQAMQGYQKQFAEATKALGKARGRLKKLRSLPEKQLAKKQEELRKAQAEVKQRKKRLEKVKKNRPTPPDYAMGVRDAQKIEDTPVRIRGVTGNKGELAPRGVLSCCTPGERVEVPKDASGRLALAQWLTNGEHPLTARVMVNRIWHHLLGRGIVPTVDNFGRNGQLPSHPELLDHLAMRFQQDGWSIKRMIRRIMLSRVYQLSAKPTPGNYEADPDNVLLWRRNPQRLEAESIRDAMLAISGQLEFSPPQGGSLVARLGDGCLVRQVDPDGLREEVNCRGVYLPAVRFFEPEMLQVFDGASASLVVGQRDETNVPAQALFLLNNEFVIKQAKHTAERILAQSDLDQASRIELVYQRILSRLPSGNEQQAAEQYIQQGLELAAGDSSIDRTQVWAGLCQALFTCAEFRYVY